MTKFRRALPQLQGTPFLTDGGLETSLIFHQGAELPHFAAFVLLETEAGRAQLEAYYRPYLELARDRGTGFVLDTPTWRANPDWGDRLGYDEAALSEINRRAVAFLLDLRAEYETPATPCVVNGVVGPRGDGYKAGRMSATEAQAYHAAQVGALTAAGADMVSCVTMTHPDEAIGIVRAAAAAAIPVVVSFTVETDGHLPSGPSLSEAISLVDAETAATPVYYMINCAHPSHFAGELRMGRAWMERIGGLRANASAKSHAELDESETLDDGDPEDLGRAYGALMRLLPNLRVLGGCCGTDHRHVAAIGSACLPVAA